MLENCERVMSLTRCKYDVLQPCELFLPETRRKCDQLVKWRCPFGMINERTSMINERTVCEVRLFAVPFYVIRNIRKICRFCRRELDFVAFQFKEGGFVVQLPIDVLELVELLLPNCISCCASWFLSGL